MRTLIQRSPFVGHDQFWGERGRFPAEWITHPDADTRLTDGVGRPIVMAFSRRFTLDQPANVRVHVSADERFELWLDGERIGLGPERGDRLNWFFDTHDLQLAAGSHLIVARVHWLGKAAPSAQITVRPGFLFCAEDAAFRDVLSTGFADWRVTELLGFSCLPRKMFFLTGDRIRIDGASFDWDWQTGEGDRYVTPVKIGPAYNEMQETDQPAYRWIIRPSLLPAMLQELTSIGRARHVEKIDEVPTTPVRVDAVAHLADEATAWDAMLSGRQAVTVQPGSSLRVIIDLEDYVCAYPELTLSGDGIVRLHWAEALYLPAEKNPDQWTSYSQKENRDAIDGKFFVGNGDEFVSVGGTPRSFPALWWSAGRYVELIATAGKSPLVIHSLNLRQTHYPHQWLGNFASDDARLGKVIPMAKRAMEMCSHETFMDCPYYEQLMYVGDTRLEALVTYTWTNDDRLPRKALEIFGISRKQPGFTQSRYPCNLQQVIPPFSAWWVAMVHDFAMWRGDLDFVRKLLPDVRGVMDAFMKCRNDAGLIQSPLGWNFLDWVPTWNAGIPKDGDAGVSGPINAKVAWVLKQAAELESICGEPEIALLQSRRAAELSSSIEKHFWNEERGLLADDLAHSAWSEHAQCMALLGDLMPPAKAQRIAAGLLEDPELARCTIYFQHYLFETFGKLGRIDRLIDHMGLWFNLSALGFKTTAEMPEPSRSDCHAWGAHPIYHYLATICGIRPAAPGMSRIEIRPQLGPLNHARCEMPHPLGGTITVDLRRDAGRLRGVVDLPSGVTGLLIDEHHQHSLGSGRTLL